MSVKGALRERKSKVKGAGKEKDGGKLSVRIDSPPTECTQAVERGYRNCSVNNSQLKIVSLDPGATVPLQPQGLAQHPSRMACLRTPGNRY